MHNDDDDVLVVGGGAILRGSPTLVISTSDADDRPGVLATSLKALR
jgi:hypothetical protein